jgi:glycosyltransferase involved in cell wall biosynthesis
MWRDRQWSLTFYGEGPQKEGLARLAHRLGLESRVTFAGFLSPVEKIWAENHVLAMPSRAEGLPLTIVEAMLCGRPVLATDVAGHAEIIEDGITGFLADAPTPSSLIETLEILWARRMELRLIGMRAAQSIRKQVPSDPAKVFAEKIKVLLTQTGDALNSGSPAA